MATAATVLASTAIVANVTLSLTAYFTSSLVTRFSTWFSLVNISRFVSFMSVCNVSRLVAICSTALVSLITAAAASSFLRLNPNSPIAATLMDAPAIAANTSITAQAGVAPSVAANPWKPTGLATRISSRWRPSDCSCLTIALSSCTALTKIGIMLAWANVAWLGPKALALMGFLRCPWDVEHLLE